MKISKSILALVIFLLLVISSEAQQLSISQVKESILQNHPSLRMYDSEAESMDAAAKGAWSWMPPELGTGFFMMPYNPKYARKTDMGEGMGQYSIAVQQMLPNKKKQAAEYGYMSTMSTVVKEKKQAVLNELIADAKKNYYEWVVIKKKLEVIIQNEKLLEFMVKDAEIRYKNGLGKLGAYYKAKAAFGNIQSMRLMFENDMRLRRINLNTLMNREKETYFDVDTTSLIKDLFNVGAVSLALVNARSDLKAIDRDIQLTVLQQELERARLKPEVGFRYEHMFGFGGQPLQYTAMAMVRIPFTSWASRMNKANIESLRLRRESLGFERQMRINELSGMASGMQTEADTKRRQLKLYEENIIPALKNNYKIMQLGYGQNTEELFELYDAWESLNMIQLEYLDQLQQLLTLQVELERILEIK
ncbi:TolC family protein [Daejeonella sp.]|uniref:TolC family protein n=1 Tax=Daejeonella sp. TaxID=2805397 RepID=UPI0039836ABE